MTKQKLITNAVTSALAAAAVFYGIYVITTGDAVTEKGLGDQAKDGTYAECFIDPNQKNTNECERKWRKERLNEKDASK